MEASSSGGGGHGVTVCRDSPTVLTGDIRSGTEVSSQSLDVHRSGGRGVEVLIRNTSAYAGSEHRSATFTLTKLKYYHRNFVQPDIRVYHADKINL